MLGNIAPKEEPILVKKIFRFLTVIEGDESIIIPFTATSIREEAKKFTAKNAPNAKSSRIVREIAIKLKLSE